MSIGGVSPRIIIAIHPLTSGTAVMVSTMLDATNRFFTCGVQPMIVY